MAVKYSKQVLDEFSSMIELPKKIHHATAKRLGTFALGIDALLNKEVHDRYAISYRTNTKGVMDRRTTDVRQAGVNVYKYGLSYHYRAINLSRFSYRWEWGNLPDGRVKRHEGKVHYGGALRGSDMILWGKSGYGAFIMPNKNKKLGWMMVERLSKKKYPIQGVLGPSMVGMIQGVLNNNPYLESKIQRDMEKLLERYIK